MSNRIVKAVSVVDDRPPVQKTFADAIEMELPNMPVIKRQLFSYRENPYADQTLVMPDKQGYIDELNRIKVEIAQAKAELRSIGGLIEETLEKAEQEVSEEQPATDTDIRNLVEEAEQKAGQIMREAHENAITMMAAAEDECKNLKEEAKNNGYLEGFEQGFAQAQNEFKNENEPKMRQLADLLEQLSNYMEEMIARNEQDLTALVMAVARKIVSREIQADPRTVATMLYQVLDENRREEMIRIELSADLMPADAKASAEIKKLIMQTAPSAMIYVDENAEPETIIVKTDGGITDLSVNTQLDNIKSMLQK